MCKNPDIPVKEFIGSLIIQKFDEVDLFLHKISQKIHLIDFKLEYFDQNVDLSMKFNTIWSNIKVPEIISNDINLRLSNIEQTLDAFQQKIANIEPKIDNNPKFHSDLDFKVIKTAQINLKIKEINPRLEKINQKLDFLITQLSTIKQRSFINNPYLDSYLKLNSINEKFFFVDQQLNEINEKLDEINPQLKSIESVLDQITDSSNNQQIDDLCIYLNLDEPNVLSKIQKCSIKTSGELTSCLHFLYIIMKKYSQNCSKKEIGQFINQKNTNFFLELCKGDSPDENDIDFLDDLIDVDYSHIFPPVSEIRVFSTTCNNSESFHITSVRVSPRIKVCCGLPGTSEIIRELFLRDTTKHIDFHRLKRNSLSVKKGFMEYQTKHVSDYKGKHQIELFRLFPILDNNLQNFQNDRFLLQVRGDVIKKVASMRGLRELVCKELQKMKICLSTETNKNAQINTNDETNNNTEKNEFVQKIPTLKPGTTKEEWNERTSAARIAENEIRIISSLSIIAAISIQIPIEEALKSIYNALPRQYTLIPLISRILHENSLETEKSYLNTGLFTLNTIVQHLNWINKALQYHGFIPNPSLRTFVINESNINHLIAYSCAISIRNHINQKAIKMIVNKLNDQELKSFICSLLPEVILEEKIEYCQEHLNNEIQPRIRFLKEKIDKSIKIVTESMEQLTKLETSEVKTYHDNSTQMNTEDLQKIYKIAIQKNAGNSEFAKAAIISVMMKFKISNSTISSDYQITRISKLILKIRNDCVKKIKEEVGSHIDVAIYEVIASKLIDIYPDQEAEFHITRLIAYKLREQVLYSIVFPRNPKHIAELNMRFPDTKNKSVSLLVNALTEILEEIPITFQKEDNIEFVKEETNECEKNSEKNSETTTKTNNENDKTDETHYLDKLIESNKLQDFSDDSNEEIMHEIDLEKETKINKAIAHCIRSHHKYIGLSAAIDVISSFYLKHIPISIPMINLIDDVIHDIPKGINITVTVNDILQLVGLGHFGFEEIDQRTQGYLSLIHYKEKDISSPNDSAKNKLSVEDEDDEGIFKDIGNKTQINKKFSNGKPHISDEDIHKYQMEILSNIKLSYESEIWLVFKKLFTTRLNSMGISIDLEHPKNLGIGWSQEFERSLQKVFQLVPLTRIKPFWRFKRNIGEFALRHGEKRVIKCMIQCFDDADRIVTPRHFNGRRKFYFEDF